MTDLERILPLWRELEAAGADYVLATLVAVEGSSYRKPGACMLLASDGRRAGTVSGGCLEAQVASRAWWLTADGPTIQRYSTAEEDGDLPYGSGCGGVIFLLLERRLTAGTFLAALEQAFNQRIPMAVATVLDGPQLGRRAFAGLEEIPLHNFERSSDPYDASAASLQATNISLRDLAGEALAGRSSIERKTLIQGSKVKVWSNYRPARPGLRIFGAGDDAQPLLNLAKELGWFVTVADGRSQLVNRTRFPSADDLRVLNIKELPEFESASPLASTQSALADLRPYDAVLILTHSFEQDARILASLLALDTPLAYIGVLGPQRRTRELLAEAARLLHLSANSTDAQIERWLSRLHAPMGLDLGAESPETIAFSVIAEIQQTFTAATALPLRRVRAAALTIPG
jgi:xanthine dehydrogenase accessory factor